MQTQVEIWNQQIQISYLTAFDLLGQVTQEYLESLKYIYFHFYVFIHPKKWGHPRSINWVTVCLLPITHAAQRRSFSWNTLILKWPLLSNIQVVPFSIFPSAWGWGDNDQIFISALTVSLNVWQPHIYPQSPYRLSVSVETDTQLVWLTHDEGRGRRWGAKKKTWRLKTH